MQRRSFLRLASGLVAAVAMPLFIPSDRLDFGVPRRLVGQTPVAPKVVWTPDAYIARVDDPEYTIRDDTAYIQGLIDAGGVVRIPAGTWYVRTLTFGSGMDLRGSGPDRTVLRGRDPVNAVVAVGPYEGTAMLRTPEKAIHDVSIRDIGFYAPMVDLPDIPSSVRVGDIPLYHGPLG